MSQINTGKVITAGLLAGLVANVIDMTTNFTVLAADMRSMVERLHLDPSVLESASGAIPWIVIDFLLGIIIVWTYAAMRPRLGPGPKTAIMAGLVPYLSITLVLYGFTSIGVFEMALFVKSSLFALVSVVAASLVGGWAYKEA